MRSKHFLSVALCGLLLTAVSCKTRSRVRSVVVDPYLGVYSYAAPGDTLEFKALNPNTSPFYVIFAEPSPCVETYLKVTKDKPGTCKVSRRSGFFRYSLSLLPPSPDSKPHSCGGCQVLFPCAQCAILITPTHGPIGVLPHPTTPSSYSSSEANAKENNVSVTSERTPVPVGCNGGAVSVPTMDVTNGDTIFWADPDALGTDLTITVPAGVCKGTGPGQVVMKQLQPCILDAVPPSYPYSYSYSVQMNDASGCGRPVIGTLNILNPNAMSTAK
jgi:hypothetical protein